MAKTIKLPPVFSNKAESEAFKKAIRETQKRTAQLLPPADIVKFIKLKAEEAQKINGEAFNKSDFILGGIAMWAHMKTNKPK